MNTRKMLAAVTGLLAVPAACAALALAPAAQASIKPHATPACGSNCQDYTSLLLANDGNDSILNAYIGGDNGRIPARPVDVNFNLASNSRPNEDWSYDIIGQVRQFCQSGLNPTGLLSATSVACTHYRFYSAFELDWQPYGNQSNLCAGTSGRVFAGQNVKLETCGAYQGTIFVLDADHPATDTLGNTYYPAIDGADTAFSHEFVLTVDPGTSRPINQLKIDPMDLLTGGVATDAQEFTAVDGPAF